MLWYAMVCNGMLWNAMACYGMLWHALGCMIWYVCMCICKCICICMCMHMYMYMCKLRNTHMVFVIFIFMYQYMHGHVGRSTIMRFLSNLFICSWFICHSTNLHNINNCVYAYLGWSQSKVLVLQVSAFWAAICCQPSLITSDQKVPFGHGEKGKKRLEMTWPVMFDLMEFDVSWCG
jgi:hypothetical protein